ncbi:MAG TPA: lysophospholipid acyltransferase family protein [Pyrinomonadaceae bacterium]|nr:lysophospholipid acyltransferase family protein [Pyrinomonadaceae bacterium]
MPERFPTVYGRADLAEYPLKQRMLIRIADLGFFAMIRLIGMTLRYEVVGEEHRAAIADADKVPIYALWHDRIFAGTYFLRDLGIVVLTSKSFDGEYIARFLTRFGFGTVRGSSSRGGVRGLVEMIRLMKQGLPMAFTVDGPRGPRYEAKSGPVMLAKKTGHPMLPFVVECKSFWTVNSWDRLQIPKPFTRASVFFAEPIYVDPDADDSLIESKRLELQTALDRIVENGKDWRTS